MLGICCYTLFIAFPNFFGSLNFEGSSPKISPVDKNTWFTDLESAKNLARKEEKTLLVDLYADWCEPCVKFEQVTFKDPTVQKELSKLIKVRLDFNTIDLTNEGLSNNYKVLGLPTILFINPEGVELKASRIEGYLKPNEFILHLKNNL